MSARDAAWTEANRAYLVAEFARLKALLQAKPGAAQEAPRTALPAEPTEAPALEQLVANFDLSPFERDLLLLAAGVEMDSELATLASEASGSPQRAFATFGLALSRLPEPHWSALTPVRPLRRFRLLELKDEQALTTSRLSVDERVLHYIAGVNYLDPRLRPLLRQAQPPLALATEHARGIEAIRGALDGRDASDVRIQLTGDDPAGQRDVAWFVASGLGFELHCLSSADIPSAPHELDALATLWQREAALLGSSLLVECEPSSATALVTRLTERALGLVFVSMREPLSLGRGTLQFAIEKPGASDQKALWQAALGPSAASLNGALDSVSTQFRLSAEAIVRTSETLRDTLGSDPAPARALWRACRGSVRTRLDDLAQRVKGQSTWEDLILPEAQKAALRQIAAHVRQRLHVHERWGFAEKGTRGLGIAALFHGESGTGKTMAAEIVANELHLDLYRIDLASTVSKYIGETEKNLSKIFDAAEEGGAVLLFDEADALFGKRSEVKDSRDRYANIEVGYLLQRVEAYRGLAILTTNSRSALDAAFTRRLRFIVQFPFPDRAQREHIWRRVFPAATPVQGLDYEKLARLDVPGGSIRNIALNAAFLAADAGEVVAMRHLLQAAHAEAAKRERPFSEAETRGWA
jgi:AAA+ superfamily predicted ATPase